MGGIFAEMVGREHTWAERWKSENPSTWRERAIKQEAAQTVVLAPRPFSGRAFSTVDFDGWKRQSPCYRDQKPRPPGTVLGRPHLLSPRAPQGAEVSPQAIKDIRSHRRRLKALFADQGFGGQAQFEFQELGRLLPPRTPRGSRRPQTVPTTVPATTPPGTPERQHAPLTALICAGSPSTTTSASHFQPFGPEMLRAARPLVRRGVLRDKQVDFRESCLRIQGQILNYSYTATMVKPKGSAPGR